ncbi:MAG: ubiquitin-like small modifier protein 1 [Thermoplasmata archaeon]
MNQLSEREQISPFVKVIINIHDLRNFKYKKVITINMATIRYYATLRPITKTKIDEIEKADNIKTLLSLLIERYGDSFRKALFNGDSLFSNVIILINGKNINSIEGLETKIENNDNIDIFPPVAGG